MLAARRQATARCSGSTGDGSSTTAHVQRIATVGCDAPACMAYTLCQHRVKQSNRPTASPEDAHPHVGVSLLERVVCLPMMM